MSRDNKLTATQDVYRKWEAMYDSEPGFDPDNPTLEQSDAYYRLMQEEFGSVASGAFGEAVAKMTPEELAELRKHPMYQDTSF